MFHRFTILFLLFQLTLVGHLRVAAQGEWPIHDLEPTTQANDRSPKFALFIPRQNPYWNINLLYARAAARQLGVKLEVHVFHDNEQTFKKLMEQVCQQDIDGVIFEPYSDSAEEILKITSKHQVPTFTIKSKLNASIEPRSTYPYWVGQSYFDYTKAGKTLFEQLTVQAERRGIKEYHVLAIQGKADQSTSKMRVNGLKQAVNENPKVKSLEVLDGQWSSEHAALQFRLHMESHPETNFVWVASESMARGVVKEIQRLGLKQPIVVGTIGINLSSMQLVREGKLHTQLGSDMLDIPLALTLMSDRFHGRDFASESTSFPLELYTIDRINFDRFQYFYSLPPDFVDFRAFSRVLQPKRTQHAYSFPDLVNHTYQAVQSRVSPNLKLTPEELAFLKAHPIIRVHNQTDAPPFSFYANGRPQGISIDYLRLVEQRLGIQFVYVTGPTWDDFLKMIENKEIDLMTNIVKTPERSQYIRFTDPYTQMQKVILTRKDRNYNTLESLKGKTIAVPKGFFIREGLEEKYGKDYFIIKDDYPNVLESIKAVSLGKADASVGSDTIMRYVVLENNISNLKFTGEAEFGEEVAQFLRLGVRDDWPIFVSILQKAMNDIPKQETQRLNQEWLGVMDSVAETPDQASTESPIQYWMTFIIGLGILLLLTLLCWLCLKLLGRKLPVGLKSSRARWAGIIAMVLFLGVAILGTTLGLMHIQHRIEQSVAQQLVTLRNMTNSSLHGMLEAEAENLRRLSQEEELLSITRAMLLARKTDNRTMLAESRERFKQFIDTEESGYQAGVQVCIIAEDYETLACSKNSLQGRDHPVYWQYPEKIQEAFKGSQVYVPVIYNLPESVMKADPAPDDPPTSAYLLNPIYASNGQIIAVAALAVDADTQLSVPFRESRYGQSGESIAFDQYGRLITASRFHDDLISMGLLKPGQSEILNFSLRDPGPGRGQSSTQTLVLEDDPFIHGVQQALNQHQGFSTFAYNDYRGVPVYGAWAWDDELQMGFLTEIDRSEALSAYYNLRLIIILILGVATLLAFFLTGLFVWNGERVNQELVKARDLWESVAEERTMALKQREQKFKAVFDQTFNRMAILDTDGKILEVNMTTLNDRSNSDVEVIGLPFWDAPWFKDDPALSDQIKEAVQLAQRGEFQRFEVEFIGHDFQERQLDFTINRITDDEGNLQFLLPMGHDITDIRQAQVEIVEQEEKFRAVFDQTAQRMAVLDMDGRILEINQQASIDDHESELIGQFFWECSWLAHSDELKQQMHQGIMHAREGVSSRFEFEHYEPGQSSPRMIDFTITTVYDQSSAPLFILAMGHDITDLKHAETQLAQNRLMIELCFNSISALIMVHDSDLRYTYVNEAYAETLSSTPQEVIGKTAADFYPPDWVERFAANNHKVMRTRESAKSVYSESEILGTGARIFDVQTYPLTDMQNEVIGIVTIAHDISTLQSTQVELERNRTLLQLLFDTIPDLVFLKDPHGCYTFANTAFLQLINSSMEELIGSTDFDHFVKEEAEVFIKEDQEILEKRKTVTFDNVLNVPGRTIIYETIKRPLINNDNVAIGVLGIARDVTEVKQIQSELEQNRALLQALFDSIPDLVFVKDLEGRYTYVNEAFAESVQMDKAAILTLTDHDMYDDEWASVFITQDEEVKSSQAIISYENTGHVHGQYSIRDTLKQPFLDAQGQTIGIMGISRDITDRKLAEKIIRESEERLRFSLVAMEAYYWVCDFESNSWHYDSDQFFLKYGYEPKDIPDSIDGFHRFIHPDDLHAMHDEFVIFLDSYEQSHRTEFRFQRSNGAWAWIQNIGQALERDEDGKLKKMVGLSLDITDRKNAEVQLKAARLESERNAKELAFALSNSEKLRDEADHAKLQAEEAARIKTEFLATMSHEIRTPMNGVLGMVQLLMESQLNQKQRQHLETIYSSGNALLAIINDILDLSKLEANRMTLDLRAYDPRQIVLAAVNLMLNRADHKGLAIHWHVDDLIPASLVGDANRIRQVLLNFISNAIKFTEDGEVSIRVYALQENNSHWLRYEVADTGIGISDQDLDKLFHEFSQVDSSISRHYEGTGLGLAICKKFVELMGGDIGVDSHENQGSCFWFKIPAMESNENPVNPELSSNRLSHLRLPPMNILLAEDNVVNQEVTEAFLLRDHHRVMIVSNGKEAVSACEEQDFDLVLMDMRMPEMDGVEATRAIRQMPAPKSEIPIIALTASVKRGDELSCKDAGMDGYVAKPIQLNLLMQAIVNATGIEPLIQEVSDHSLPNVPSELIDMDQLKLITDISSQESLIHIIRTYLKEMLPEIEALGSLVETKAWADLHQSAHRIKGASANLALSSIASAMLEIEQLLEEQQYEELPTSIKHVSVVTNATLMELRQLYPKAFQQDDLTTQENAPRYDELSQLEFTQLIEQLDAALQSSQPQRITKSLHPLKWLKMPPEQQSIFNKVVTQVEAYQYHKAHETLTKLIAELDNRRQDSD